jgi:hypothetical protein
LQRDAPIPGVSAGVDSRKALRYRTPMATRRKTIPSAAAKPMANAKCSPIMGRPLADDRRVLANAPPLLEFLSAIASTRREATPFYYLSCG